eukprot:1412212-Prymnesium_polylepis.3
MGRSALLALLACAGIARADEECEDTAGWHNKVEKTCADYAENYCANRAFKAGNAWLGGEAFNWPERNCCECGKRPPAPPPAPKKPATYEVHHNLACKGADHQVKKVTVATCQAHCAERKCACFHYGKGLCRFGFRFLGLVKSTSGFAAYVRTIDGVEIAMESNKPPLAPRAAAAESCAPPAARVPPSFYLYEGEAFDWVERLVACYQSKAGRPPWQHEVGNRSLAELGPTPPVDLA